MADIRRIPLLGRIFLDPDQPPKADKPKEMDADESAHKDVIPRA